jgi:polysaccharide biosynthesis protein PelF
VYRNLDQGRLKRSAGWRAEGPSAPRRILFVFAWLVVGGEETEVRLLAKHLDRRRYRLEVVACMRKPNMPEMTHDQLAALGVPIDRTPYTLSYEDTVNYLAGKAPAYDLVVACQAVPDIYPALGRLEQHPPLIEHGGLVAEALRTPKHLTTRYVGVCRSIRDAAASLMPGRPHHALAIPSMVDLGEFQAGDREQVRALWNVGPETPVIGWVGRLDRKKRVEDFIWAAAFTRRRHPEARFVIVGGPDAFMPEYAGELRQLANRLRLGENVMFLGDRPDVARLMAGMDIFVWLSRNEGMPHVISEAGAAGLPVIATRDNGSEEQIIHGVTGLFVPHRAPSEVADTVHQLIVDPARRTRLGSALRSKVEREYSTSVVARRWETLFDEVIAEHAVRPPARLPSPLSLPPSRTATTDHTTTLR